MKHLPNLLKQESSSAATLVHILLRMYYDTRSDHLAARPQIADRLLPYVLLIHDDHFSQLVSYRFRLGLGVLQDYNKLKTDTQSKNIIAWTPVVAEILGGLSRLDDKAVSVSFLPRCLVERYPCSFLDTCLLFTPWRSNFWHVRLCLTFGLHSGHSSSESVSSKVS